MYSNKKFVYQLCSTLLLKHKLYLMLIKFVFPLRTYWVLTKLKFTCAPVSLISTIYFKSHKIHNFCYMHFIPVKVKKTHTHENTCTKKNLNFVLLQCGQSRNYQACNKCRARAGATHTHVQDFRRDMFCKANFNN